MINTKHYCKTSLRLQNYFRDISFLRQYHIKRISNYIKNTSTETFKNTSKNDSRVLRLLKYLFMRLENISILIQDLSFDRAQGFVDMFLQLSEYEEGCSGGQVCVFILSGSSFLWHSSFLGSSSVLRSTSFLFLLSLILSPFLRLGKVS